MKLSVVSTLYRSSAFVEEFHHRVRSAAERVTDDFEIILVDDGSPDDSLAKAVALCTRDPRLRVLELSRNFGHHRAIMTGLTEARGELVFLIDSDLEEPPEALLPFLEALERQEADVVYGVQEGRKGGSSSVGVAPSSTGCSAC